MSDPVLFFRPHHFLCALGFQGAGYDDAFTANMNALVNGRLRAIDGDQTQITVTFQADSLCAPCPERRGAGCTKTDKITRLDKAHAAALGLKDGDRLSWGDGQSRIVENVQPGDLTQLCAGCQWLEMGACEEALADLHAAKHR